LAIGETPPCPSPHRGGDEVKRVVLRHAELHEKKYGSLVSFRKHLLYYFKGFDGAKDWRQRLVKVKTTIELEEILKGS